MKYVKIFRDIVHSVCVCVEEGGGGGGGGRGARGGRALKMGVNFYRLVETGFYHLPSYDMIKFFLL